MRKAKQSESSRMMRPALTPEARENQLVSLAVDLAEKQLREGTASSQVITHYLKLGSTKERIEKEILEKQKELIEAKTQNLKSIENSCDLQPLRNDTSIFVWMEWLVKRHSDLIGILIRYFTILKNGRTFGEKLLFVIMDVISDWMVMRFVERFLFII